MMGYLFKAGACMGAWKPALLKAFFLRVLRLVDGSIFKNQGVKETSFAPQILTNTFGVTSISTPATPFPMSGGIKFEAQHPEVA